MESSRAARRAISGYSSEPAVMVSTEKFSNFHRVTESLVEPATAERNIVASATEMVLSMCFLPWCYVPEACVKVR